MSPALAAAWVWPAALLLAAAALVLDLRFAPPAGRAGRLLATWMAIGALALLAARQPVAAAGPLVLLTPGAIGEAESSPPGGAAVLAADRDRVARRGLVEFADAAALARARPGIRRLRLEGWGLPPWELDELEAELDRFEPPPPPAGVLAAAWRRRIGLGERLVVRGRVALGGAPRGMLTLAGPAGEVESIELEGGESGFELADRPRGAGRWLYRLRLERPERAPIEETLETHVAPSPAPAVLWLEGAPSFETRHVKHWLRESGVPLAVRTEVSRGRFRTEFHGRQPISLDRLDEELLSGIDVLVLDRPAFERLASGERERLRRQVSEAGLGVLLRAASGDRPPLPADALWRGLRLEKVDDGDEMSVRLRLPELGHSAPLTVPGRELVAAPGHHLPILDAAGRGMVAARQAGAGRAAVALPEATHRWVLAGEVLSHRAYWSAVLSFLARPPAAAAWRLPEGPLRLQEPLELALSAPGDPPPAAVRAPGGAVLRLPLRQDLFEPERWHTTWRPRQPGWHLLAAGGAEEWIWVPPEGSWSAFDAARRIAATRLAARAAPPAAAAPERAGAPGGALPARWPAVLWAAALGALGWLWAEPLWRLSRG